MEMLYHLAWRGYPALILAALGIVLILRAVLGERDATIHYRFGTDTRSRLLMRDFRRAVIGLALIAGAGAWYGQIPWLLAVAVVVGIGETMESSADLVALERAERLRPSAVGSR